MLPPLIINTESRVAEAVLVQALDASRDALVDFGALQVVDVPVQVDIVVSPCVSTQRP